MTRLYQLVMDSGKNPLSHIPDMNTRHMIMQVLAWMWCIVFSSWMGSIFVFGVSALVHAILLAGIFITLEENEIEWKDCSYTLIAEYTLDKERQE
jgi:asparagine N-glycosylation enzyme membrane subunit Stt3